jgi:MinD-like ATPase involved in chromosome partitioning or flagellar assembly
VLERLSRSIASRVMPKPNTSPMVIAVSGPYGSSGKTTVAINIALELSAEKARVLLIDAHTQGPSVANHFLLSEQPPGLAAALRISNQQRFDLEQLERVSFQFQKSSLRIMPGSQSLHGQSFDESAIGSMLAIAKQSFDFTVVDLSAVPVDDLSQQAALTRSILAQADKSVLVALADPVGIFRLLNVETTALELTSEPLLVINRVRNSVISQARSEIAITLQRLSSLEPKAYLPDDPSHIDQALKTGVPATFLSRSGTFRQALTGFVRAELLGLKGQLDSRVAKLG